MAGYSGTPLPRKLGIKPGSRLSVADAPDDFEATLGELPDGVEVARGLRSRGPFDVIVAFCRSSAQLDRTLAAARPRMAPACGLWIAWPKKASGVATDLTENVVRTAALEAGLVDNKVCAIDETWSGLRLVIRVKDRA
jgi:hypothetical protein